MIVTSKNIEPNNDSDDKVENNFKRVAAETEISCDEPRPGVSNLFEPRAILTHEKQWRAIQKNTPFFAPKSY